MVERHATKKIVDVPKVQIVQKIAGVNRVVGQVVEKSVEEPKVVEQVAENVSVVPQVQPVQNFVGVNKGVEHAVEKIVEDPEVGEQATAKVVVVPQAQVVQKIDGVNRVVERAIEKTAEAPQVVKQAAEKVVALPEVQVIQKIAGVNRIVGRTVDQIVEKPNVVETIVEKVGPQLLPKIIEVPKVVDRVEIVNVPKVEEKVIDKVEIIEVPKVIQQVSEKIIKVPKVIEMVVEKVVPTFVPEIIEVPKVVKVPIVMEKVAEEVGGVVEQPVQKVIELPQVHAVETSDEAPAVFSIEEVPDSGNVACVFKQGMRIRSLRDTRWKSCERFGGSKDFWLRAGSDAEVLKVVAGNACMLLRLGLIDDEDVVGLASAAHVEGSVLWGFAGDQGRAQDDKAARITINGLTKCTTPEMLKSYFTGWGAVVNALVMPGGIGKVVFESENTIDLVLQDYDKHSLDGEWIQVAHDKSPDGFFGYFVGETKDTIDPVLQEYYKHSLDGKGIEEGKRDSLCQGLSSICL